MTQILRKTNKLKFHTDLKELIKPFKVEFPTFKWMLTNQDYIVLDYETKGLVNQLDFGIDRIIFEGDELLEIIESREVQFIWGVFCAFENNVPKLDKDQLPFADCNSKIWSEPEKFFLQESKIEIICFDGTSTLIRFRDKDLENKFVSYFNEAITLEKKNVC